MEFVVLPFTAQNWPAAAAIYSAAIQGGRATFTAECPSYEEWNAAHLPSPRLAALNEKGECVGFAALSPVSARTVYCGVCEVSIYVSEAFRGHGCGRALLCALVQQAEQAGIWTLQAVICEQNLASLALFRAGGFRTVGVREAIAKDRFSKWQNTVLLEKRSKTIY